MAYVPGESYAATPKIVWMNCVGGRKFASLASQAAGLGNLMLTLEQQAAFVEEAI
jgi:hypothetical protein